MLIKKIFTILIVAATISTAANAQNAFRTVTEFGSANKPESITTDASGNLHIIERFGAKVRKVDFATHAVTTIISTGLSNARGIAFDESGNFYLADQHKITKYTAAGASLGVVAGSGTAGYSGDGGAATLAAINNPFGLAYDKVNKYLYIAEQGSNVIRKINFSVATPTISTFAGTQGANDYVFDAASSIGTHFKQPAAIALDANGDVYWSGILGGNVFKSTKDGTTVKIIAGASSFVQGNAGDGGVATSSTIGGVSSGGLAFDALGNLYLSDATNHRVRKVVTTGTTGVFGNIVAYAGYTNFVSGTTTVTSSGDLADAIVTTGTSTTMNSPSGIAFNPAGTILFIAENNGSLIRAVGLASVLSATLPLDLTSFDAKAVNETAVLNWTTENEVNFKEFVVERKGENGASFTPIKTIPTKKLSGTTSYSFTDASKLKGTNYYQLKMVDNDGTFKLSDVKAVKFASLSITQLNVYPNPVQNILNLNHSEAGLDSSISIYGLDGKLIANKSVSKNSTQSTYDTSSLKTGQYILEFNNNGSKQVIKFIK